MPIVWAIALILGAAASSCRAATQASTPPNASLADVVSLEVHRETGVWTAVLSTGIVIHARRDPTLGPIGRVAVALGRGRHAEPPELAGVTDALAAALADPAYVGVDDFERATLTSPTPGRTTEIQAVASDDSLVVLVESPTPFVHHPLLVVRELLTDAEIDRDALSAHNARRTARPVFRQQYQAALADLLSIAHPSPVELNADDVSRWLDAMRRDAPIEVGIASAVAPPQMIDAARAMLGTLPARPAPSREQWSRVASRDTPELPARLVRTHSTPDRVAAVMRGAVAPTPGARSTTESIARLRALYLVGVILDRRLAEVPSVGSASTLVDIITPFDGSIVLTTVAICDPAQTGEVALAIESAMLSLVRDGPTPEELVAAVDSFTRLRMQRRAEEWYWPALLAKLRWHGFGLDAFSDGNEAYERMTVEDVQRAAAETFRPEHGIALDLVPEPRD